MQVLQLKPAPAVFGSAKSGFRGVTAALQRLSIAQAPAARSSLVVEGERPVCCAAGPPTWRIAVIEPKGRAGRAMRGAWRHGPAGGAGRNRGAS